MQPDLLPTFEQELVSAQRQAVRITCLVASPLLLAFSALDALVVPGAWGLLFGLRLGAAGLFALLAWLLARFPLPPFPALAAVIALVMVPIEVGVLHSGGASGLYVYAALLPMAGASLLVPLRPRQAATICGLVLASVYVPIFVVAGGVDDIARLWAGAAYLGCMAFLTVVGAAVHQRVFRREYESRHLAARQVGLANLGMLAGGLAHEIANPLSVITYVVDQMRSDPDLSERAGHKLERLDRGVSRMRDVLEAMRSGTREASGRMSPVALDREIDQAILLLEDRLRAGIELRREVEPVPSVQAERTLIGQVLLNLLLNAVQAVEARTPPRIITIRLRREDDVGIVEVEDNGPGVPEAIRDRIFQPLYTTKGEGGTGLGLWLGAEIARAHRGSLTLLESSEGGASFRLTLPLNRS